MKLYHHTSATLLEAVLDDALNRGQLALPDGRFGQGIVWLTSDPLPYHHGLLDGTPLDEKGMVAATIPFGQRPANPQTHNKREVRISLDSEDLPPGWMPFVEWAQAVGASQDYVRGMGISAIDGIDAMDGATFRAVATSGISREGTWYLVPHAIDPDRFVAIDAFVDGGHVPYEFEAHGRTTLAKHGLVYPEPSVLASLPAIGQPRHRYDRFTVHTFAPTAAAPPHVRFRGYGRATAVTLDEACAAHPITGPHGDEAILRDWVRAQREALLPLWDRAVAVARAHGME